MGAVIGIDLGTTNTVVAVVEGGRPRVLEDSRGYRVIPSCVAAKETGRFVVGHAAKSMILTHPDRTVYAVKRLLGRPFDAPETQEAVSRVGYHVEPTAEGWVQLRVGERTMSPVEVIAVVLRVARETAEAVLGEPVQEAVVTVPAYFNHRQRSSTLEAARRAGLHCERLLNEPTAAALAYGHRREVAKVVLVFDLGGGTFDVSVLHLSRGVYEVLATLGDTFLGGEDFDYRLVDHLALKFLKKGGVDVRKDATTLQRLKEAAERAKCELSFSDQTTIFLPRLSRDDNLDVVIRRETLEELVEDLVQRTLDVAQKAVSDAGLYLDAVDDVILVGGQTRMPRIREAIEEVFGRKPSATVHPEEVVALGAALHAEALARLDGEAPVLIDVTPFDLGIDAAGGSFTSIIQRNSKVPTSRSRTFTTVVDNQESVRIIVRQGQSSRSAENEFLGELVLFGIPEAPRMKPKLDVTFRIDASGMLRVSAKDQATQEAQQITIEEYPQLGRKKDAGEATGDLPPLFEKDETTEILAPQLRGFAAWLKGLFSP
jgi:molecular chaperone DnaK